MKMEKWIYCSFLVDNLKRATLGLEETASSTSSQHLQSFPEKGQVYYNDRLYAEQNKLQTQQNVLPV
jgi:hypothetical protein